MANANDPMAMLQENLVDAGCDPNDIACFMDMARSDQWSAMLPTLNSYRRQLLGNIHKEQSKLDCLDYLIFRISKEHGR